VIELGVMCSLYLEGTGEWLIAPDEWDKIDAAWQEFVSTGRTRDRILECAQPSGAEFLFLVSQVVGMARSTRDSRAKARERDLAFKDEARADGIIDTD
jgi:hypothetical protein